MERSITLGGKEYKYNITFKMSYNFLKYRNRITKGFDISSIDKSVAKEILEMQEKIAEVQKEGGNELKAYEFLNELSPAAKEFLNKNQKTDSETFTQEEIIEIVSVFTGEKDENKIYEILDKELEETGFDVLISKLITAITMVFMSAKANS